MLKEFFAWWTGNTWGTRFTLWKAGAEPVGADELGNRYYRSRISPDHLARHTEGQKERRWVIYKDQSEASLVPSLWHGWLHHQSDELPTQQNRVRFDWQLPHLPNQTGTPEAYHPPGSIIGRNQRPATQDSYEAWKPESGNQKPESGNLKPELGNRKPDILPLKRGFLILIVSFSGFWFLTSGFCYAQRIENPIAEFAGLDKITARIIKFEVKINETVQFGALQVTPKVCYNRASSDDPLTTGFLEVDEIALDGKVKRIFSGWMFADSPGINAIEHPIYDIWLVACKGGKAPPPSETDVNASKGIKGDTTPPERQIEPDDRRGVEVQEEDEEEFEEEAGPPPLESGVPFDPDELPAD